jgi:predicted DNA-binding transcriptional regulator AlpA
MRERQLLQWICISRSSLWKMIREGNFPKPIRLSERISVWETASVEDFLQRFKTAASASVDGGTKEIAAGN